MVFEGGGSIRVPRHVRMAAGSLSDKAGPMVNESGAAIRLSRISKLFVDRDGIMAPEALLRRQDQSVTLICGSDIGESYTLQLAVLTAASLAARCFPGAVRVALDDRQKALPLLLWPTLDLTLGQALSAIVGAAGLSSRYDLSSDRGTLVFGDANAPNRALRVTFDGWIAAIGPATTVNRLPERDFCPLSGLLSASLAVSEIFLSFAEISIEATRRPIAISLWRPEADVRDPVAQGVPMEFLPKNLWVLGLGHLGNAYLWALGALPYRDVGEVEVFLNDFDRVDPENVETGLLFSDSALKQYKTRVCSSWLEKRGFQTRIVERRFDEHFRCQADEPQLALCGFDKNPPRRSLETAKFLRVIESGLGGRADNFDVLAMHTLPNPRPAAELWPDYSPEERAAEVKRLTQVAQDSTAYAALEGDECGRFELAGQSVAVPFVGTTAASFVIAEAVRLFHNGPAYSNLKTRLGTPSELRATSCGTYTAQSVAQLLYAKSK